MVKQQEANKKPTINRCTTKNVRRFIQPLTNLKIIVVRGISPMHFVHMRKNQIEIKQKVAFWAKKRGTKIKQSTVAQPKICGGSSDHWQT